jgi:hypothetical protein
VPIARGELRTYWFFVLVTVFTLLGLTIAIFVRVSSQPSYEDVLRLLNDQTSFLVSLASNNVTALS